MVLNELDCVNEHLSDFVKFGENHPIRPDLAGKYELFYKLILNKEKCASHSIFKIKGFSQYIIINELVMNCMRDANVKGVFFEEI